MENGSDVFRPIGDGRGEYGRLTHNVSLLLRIPCDTGGFVLSVPPVGVLSFFPCATDINSSLSSLLSVDSAMGVSTQISRFFTLLCVALPLYFSLRSPTSSSDIRIFLSHLSRRAEAVHVALVSPVISPAVSIPTETLGIPVERVKSTRALTGSRQKQYPSLPDGLAHCINSFEQYQSLAERVLERKHARYAKQTYVQKAISNKLGYPAHFEKAKKGIEVNSLFSEQIAQIARKTYRTGFRALEDEEDAEFGVVDLAFGHLVRDWTKQGAKERHAVFPPVLNGLEQHFGQSGGGKKILVPGSGMGRLASDIADLGAFSPISLSLKHPLTQTHNNRLRRDCERIRLRIYSDLSPINKSHAIVARAHPPALRN
jgi:hypothetical protein